MICEKIDVRGEGSQTGAALYTYILGSSPEFLAAERPLIIICPGGGYSFCSEREAEPVALQFNAMGYHAAVLRYSVAPSRYPAAMLELGRSVLALRDRAAEWKINPDKIAVAGFSAGGHLAASYCLFWKQEWMAEALLTETAALKPGAMILGYPVITSGEFAHMDSFTSLLGEKLEERKDELSLEKKVSDAVPRTFIWHTFEDNAVPVQNSLLFVESLVKHQIPVEFHMFEKGGHGLALANRVTQNNAGAGVEPTCECWITMAGRWLENWSNNR